MQPTTYIRTFSHSLLSWTLGSNLPTLLPIVHHHNSFPASQPASQQLFFSNALGALLLRKQPDRQYPLLLSSNRVPRVAINLKQDDSQLRESLALVICSIRSTLPRPSCTSSIWDVHHPISLIIRLIDPTSLWSDVCMHAYSESIIPL